MANVKSRVFDKKKLCEFVIQCCIDEGTVAEVDKSESESKSKSKSESKSELQWNLEFKRKIPNELFIEILIRLPNKCLCRYRAVNKHWCNLISSNHFIDRHVNYLRELNGSHFVPDSFTIVFQNRFWCRSVSEATNSSLEALPIHPNIVSCKSYNRQGFIPPLMQSKSVHADTPPTDAVASSRDLLLCASFLVSTYYVVNLFTKQLLVLPSAPPLDHGQQPALNRKPTLGIICYDSDGIASGWCRFKVILVSNPPEFGSSLFTLRIFCSDTGEWTKLMADWYPWTAGTDCLSGPMVAHRGMLYWVNDSSLVSLDLFNGDPNTRLSHMMKLHDEALGFDSTLDLGVTQGHLCLATVHYTSGPSFIKVWQVEDNHKQLLYTTMLPFSCFATIFSIVAFHPYKSDAIFVQRGPYVYLLDMKNATFDEYVEMKLDQDYRFVKKSRAVLLHHQWFPTPLPSSHPLVDSATLCSNPSK